MKSKPVFEHEFCSRCGGSGEYSYNQMHGTRCFGCGGTGYRLTKRGLAAQNFYTDSLSVPASELKAGDLIRYDFFKPSGGFVRKFTLIEEVKICTQKESGCYQVGREGELVCVIKTKDATIHGSPNQMYRKGWDELTKRARLNAALTYQNSLTKAGKPRKSAAAAA